MNIVLKLINHHRVAIFLLFLLFIIFAVLVFLSYDPIELDESIHHYLYSRYALQHPRLLLDPWQRPLFAVLSAPFAQFGFEVFRLFNVACALGAAFFGYLIARRLGFKNAPLIIIFILFSPLYFGASISGLTEILFSFSLLVSIYCWINNRLIIALMIGSFLPYIRQEGIVVIGAYCLLLIWNKKSIKFFPWLFFGTTVMSVVASINRISPVWIVQSFWENNYKYGSGSLVFFIKEVPTALGILSLCYFIIGVFTMRTIASPALVFMYLLFFMFTSLLLTYSILWWKGLFATLNLARYLNTILPIASIFTLHGFNATLELFNKHRYLQTLFYVLTILVVIIMPFVKYTIPVVLPETQSFNQITARWYLSSSFIGSKLYACDYFLPFYLNSDPFDEENFQLLSPLMIQSLSQNALVVWDPFCFSEISLTKEKLNNMSNLELVNSIASDVDKKMSQDHGVVVYRVVR